MCFIVQFIVSIVGFEDWLVFHVFKCSVRERREIRLVCQSAQKFKWLFYFRMSEKGRIVRMNLTQIHHAFCETIIVQGGVRLDDASSNTIHV